jgi:hypothetical protein
MECANCGCHGFTRDGTIETLISAKPGCDWRELLTRLGRMVWCSTQCEAVWKRTRMKLARSSDYNQHQREMETRLLRSGLG